MGSGLMNSLSPQDMARYISRLHSSKIPDEAKEIHVRALYLVLVTIIDTELRQSSTDLAQNSKANSRLKDSFQASVSHASLAATVDLNSHDRSEGASNTPKQIRGNAP